MKEHGKKNKKKRALIESIEPVKFFGQIKFVVFAN